MRHYSDKPQTLEFWRGRLPHWEVLDAIYFITIHLSGIIPASGARRIRNLSREMSNAQRECRFALQNKIFAEMDRWLDRPNPRGQLTHPGVAAAIMEAIHYRIQKNIWRVHEFVIMSTHVHLMTEICCSRLRTSMISFKERTGREAVKILDRRARRFWQSEWFDHWIRSPEEEEAVRNYIRMNPVKAKLVSDYRQWPYGSWNTDLALR